MLGLPHHLSDQFELRDTALQPPVVLLQDMHPVLQGCVPLLQDLAGDHTLCSDGRGHGSTDVGKKVMLLHVLQMIR